MKFDIIIGNPPYNNDAYVDFILCINELSLTKTLMITPSKWFAKYTDSNCKFRDSIVPFMEYIAFYPETKEVFDVDVPDGISYYSINKIEHPIKIIKNISSRQKLFNNTEQRELEYHINNAVNNIIKKVISKEKEFITVSTDRAYFIKANTLVFESSTEDSVKVFGGDSDGNKLFYGYLPRNYVTNHLEDIDKYKVIIQFKFGKGIFTLDSEGKTLGLKNLNIYEPKEICKDDYLVLLSTTDINEAESFKSYLYTKLIRFLIYAGCVGSNASNNETWRFVPKVEYNHTFTDNELYNKYQLTEQEICLISTVMKERT